MYDAIVWTDVMISNIHFIVYPQSIKKNKPPTQTRLNTYRRFPFRSNVAAGIINIGIDSIWSNTQACGYICTVEPHYNTVYSNDNISYMSWRW